MAMQQFRHLEAVEPVFEVRSEDEDGLTRVSLCGELDLAAVPLLEEEYQRIEDRGSQVVALDLAGLTFIDAVGLSAVLSFKARACKDGRVLPVVRAGPAVRRVFELTGNGGLLISLTRPPVSHCGDHRG